MLLAFARRWVLAGAAVTVSVTALATQIPLFRRNTARGTEFTLTLMSVNLFLGKADAASLLRSAQTDVDLVAVQELTPEELRRLSAVGFDTVFPYRLVDARPYASGIGLWSRYPITESRTISGYQMPFIGAKIQVPGVAIDPTVIVAHLPNPFCLEEFRHDIALLPSTFENADTWSGGGPVLVAGDFNSTLDMRPFRELLKHGYRDAAEQAGAGFKPTFHGGRWMTSLIAIDHVLTLRCAALSLDTLAVAGSDHRAIVTTVDIPKVPPSGSR